MNPLQEYRAFRKEVLSSVKTVRYDHFVKNHNLIPDVPGVYLIYRTRDGHPYVGESKDVRRRLLDHALVSHPTQYVDREIRKAGLEQFQVAFLEKAGGHGYRRKREGWYVRLFNSYRNGFNGSEDGGAMTLGQRYWRQVRRTIFKTLFPKAYKKRQQALKIQGARRLKRYYKLNRRKG